ncbi:MAG: PolC-type DNA polymerase III [Oscillospiraceae bacterium]|jgi:DNA polymerase-3 subunit alpha (Gram-positive type)|nr:PolC-type DNA polymerase III [Oscillospiraceae bacterium]
MPQSAKFSKLFPTIDIDCFRDAEVLGVTISADRTELSADISARSRVTDGDVETLKKSLIILYKLARVSINLRAPSAPEPEPAPAPRERKLAPAAQGTNETPRREKSAKPPDGVLEVLLGRPAKQVEITPMSELDLGTERVTVEGRVFSVQHREVRQGRAWVVSFDVTDGGGSIRVTKYMAKPDAADAETKRSRFFADDDPEKLVAGVTVGSYVRVTGKPGLDRYENNDMTLAPYSVCTVAAPKSRSDAAEVKRVELHLHTMMSAHDGLCDVSATIRRAIEWGHPAIAITDHGVVHSFPDAAHAAGDKIKVLYGVEGYFVNDLDGRPAVFGGLSALPDEFVAFDLETTGLSAWNDRITEIGAVVFRNGEPAETFHTYTNPGIKIPANITELTGITDAAVADAPANEAAVRAFLDFAGERVLVAHNAGFDLGFVYETCWKAGIPFDPVCFDTVTLARAFLPKLTNHKLPTVAAELKIPGLDHHHALSDCTVTGHIAARFIENLRAEGLANAREINLFAREASNLRREKYRHIIIFARTQAGVKNLYKLVTKSHLEHFSKNPVIPKSLLTEYRGGLLLGSACEAGEVFGAVEKSSRFEQHRLARFYDYLEIQPTANNAFMLRDANRNASSLSDLEALSARIVALGDELGIPVCATCDAHFLDPEDEIYRKILLNGKGFSDALYPLPLYFRTTDEMLAEFAFLGAEKARELVVTNTRKIADMCENVSPLPPKKLFPPRIEGSAELLKTLVYAKMRELYGENPPEIITKRTETELSDILSRGYDVIYITAQKLVRDSLDHGYLVGSRGSVGSSVVAYFAGITEVNALPPHYLCPKCRHTDFAAGEGSGCGADMPDAVCPECGAQYKKEGFDIPFETFLGFGGDKVPDIDLNFSGEYQAEAHRRTIELFGADRVFRAGTIGTIATETAYGYVRKYLETTGGTATRSEELRLAQGIVGVKRTTSQHPGGLIVIPDDMEITDFCPAQHPADDSESDIITTHFEYHSMEDNLLKLDELGHDVPTMIKMLGDMTGVSPDEIPLDDPDALAAFRDPRPLGIEPDEYLGETGSIGIPEFGTGFTRQMLRDTMPAKVSTLVRLSGYSHGTDVWLGNAKDIIMNKVADISDTIGCRDDIMLYLISRGIGEKTAFAVMESVRKGNKFNGKGIPADMEDVLHEHDVPDWYIESCRKIKYLFPKAHAVAYVMMGLRVAWFKVHRPLEFYAAHFYLRSQKGCFDADIMTRGDELACEKLREFRMSVEKEKKSKNAELIVTLEACHEFYKRGFRFGKVDIYGSDAARFVPSGGDTLTPPLISVAGLGETVARDIARGRAGQRFVSVEDFQFACPKVSVAHIAELRKIGSLDDMPDTSQMSLF